MKKFWFLSPIVGIVGLAVMGILSERKADSWRELAHESVGAAQECVDALSERTRLLNELSAGFCREHVHGGCPEFVRLTRRSEGVYECLCRQ